MVTYIVFFKDQEVILKNQDWGTLSVSLINKFQDIFKISTAFFTLNT